MQLEIIVRKRRNIPLYQPIGVSPVVDDAIKIEEHDEITSIVSKSGHTPSTYRTNSSKLEDKTPEEKGSNIYLSVETNNVQEFYRALSSAKFALVDSKITL